MTDWVTIAKATGLNLASKELDRIAQPLTALEETLRPLIKDLTPEIEPAFEFHMEENE
jgi:hypothetical protein